MMLRPRIRVLLTVAIVLATGNTALAEPSLRAIDEAIEATDYDRALELLDTQLAATPDDVTLRLRRARVRSYVGDYDTALNALDALREEYPHDVDYALARAQVLARQGRDREALDDLRQAAALAPEYEEVWEFRYTLLSRQPAEKVQLERDAVLREAAARFPRASWWRSTEEVPAAQWTVLVGAGHENLDNDLPSWNQQFIEFSRDHGSAGRYRVSVARDERFDNSDLSILLGGDILFASDWSAGFDFTFVDDAEFQPDYGYSTYVGKSLQDGWIVSLSYRRREYEAATVGSAMGTVEKYLGDFRIAYALGLSHLHGASNSLNHSLTANWYYSDRSSIGISLNTGEEAEAIGPGQVLETDVRGVSVSGRRRLTNRLGLQWWLGLHEQGDYYRRQYVGMALTIQL